MPRLAPTLCLALLLPSDLPPETAGRLDHEPIRECSGIVRSRRHEGAFWVHNDSGNAPALFAVRRDGTLLREYRLTVPNIDWEDIATDNGGKLYIGDIGNNGEQLPVRVIHCLEEPDPAAPAPDALRPVRSVHFRFPDALPFDAEGLFILDGQAVIVRKRRDGGEADLYAVPLDQPAPLLRPVLAKRLGALPGFVEQATGADLSADGQRLAVCSYGVVRVYRVEAEGGDFRCRPLGEARFPAVGGIEAVCWDGRSLILAGESRGVFRLDESSWRRGRR
jgi:hypothetical protein